MILFNPLLGYKGLHTFPKSIRLKVNIMASLEFELAYYDFAVEHLSHYTMGSIPPRGFEKYNLMNLFVDLISVDRNISSSLTFR